MARILGHQIILGSTSNTANGTCLVAMSNLVNPYSFPQNMLTAVQEGKKASTLKMIVGYSYPLFLPGAMKGSIAGTRKCLLVWH